MGFPNVDLILRDLFLADFQATKTTPEFAVADLFDDRSEEEQAEIVEYLISRRFTGSVQDRGDDRRVFILPHFPVSDLPFPQIGIYSGEVDGLDRLLGDYSGESEAVKNEDGEVIGWAQIKGYWEVSSWNIDVVTATKDEAIWLARLCQYFICQSFQPLTEKGILEIDVMMTDLRPEKSTLQPLQYFVRGLKVRAKVANTWKKRLPVSYYETGVNLALTTP